MKGSLSSLMMVLTGLSRRSTNWATSFSTRQLSFFLDDSYNLLSCSKPYALGFGPLSQLNHKARHAINIILHLIPFYIIPNEPNNCNNNN